MPVSPGGKLGLNVACALVAVPNVIGVAGVVVRPADTDEAALPTLKLIALLVSWLGLAVAYYTPYPAGFFLTTFAFAVYLLAWMWRFFGHGGRRRVGPMAEETAAEGVIVS